MTSTAVPWLHHGPPRANTSCAGLSCCSRSLRSDASAQHDGAPAVQAPLHDSALRSTGMHNPHHDPGSLTSLIRCYGESERTFPPMAVRTCCSRVDISCRASVTSTLRPSLSHRPRGYRFRRAWGILFGLSDQTFPSGIIQGRPSPLPSLASPSSNELAYRAPRSTQSRPCHIQPGTWCPGRRERTSSGVISKHPPVISPALSQPARMPPPPSTPRVPSCPSSLRVPRAQMGWCHRRRGAVAAHRDLNVGRCLPPHPNTFRHPPSYPAPLPRLP